MTGDLILVDNATLHWQVNWLNGAISVWNFSLYAPTKLANLDLDLDFGLSVDLVLLTFVVMHCNDKCVNNHIFLWLNYWYRARFFNIYFWNNNWLMSWNNQMLLFCSFFTAEYSPYLGLEKGAVLQEARVFNDPQLDPRKCSQVFFYSCLVLYLWCQTSLGLSKEKECASQTMYIFGAYDLVWCYVCRSSQSFYIFLIKETHSLRWSFSIHEIIL